MRNRYCACAVSNPGYPCLIFTGSRKLLGGLPMVVFGDIEKLTILVDLLGEIFECLD